MGWDGMSGRGKGTPLHLQTYKPTYKPIKVYGVYGGRRILSHLFIYAERRLAELLRKADGCAGLGLHVHDWFILR